MGDTVYGNRQCRISLLQPPAYGLGGGFPVLVILIWRRNTTIISQRSQFVKCCWKFNIAYVHPAVGSLRAPTASRRAVAHRELDFDGALPRASRRTVTATKMWYNGL